MTEVEAKTAGRQPGAAFLNAAFDRIDPESQARLLSHAKERELECGEILFREGELSTEVALVYRGLLSVTIRGPTGEEIEVGQLGRGQSVGEMAFMLQSARTATVRALRKTTLLVLDVDTVKAACNEHPGLGLALATFLAERLRAAQTPRRHRPRMNTAVFVPLAPDVDVRQAAHAVSSRCAHWDSVTLIDEAKVNATLGAGAAQSPTHDALERWLDDQEDRHGIDFYVAGHTLDPWTRRCLSRADRLIFVANQDGSPRPTELERTIALEGTEPNLAQRELILVHKSDLHQPGSTRPWLDARPGVRHHNVRRGHGSDWSRVTRILMGRAVGLVLGGGGARGIAHVGVIQALAEAGIPIDIIGGASSGGGVATLFAAGYSGSDIIRAIRAAWRDSGVLRSYTLPTVSFLRTKRARKVVQEYLSDVCMEDLWTPCYCVGTNLSKARVEQLDRGPAWRALMATSAIPGAFPPVIVDGDLIVDGGVRDNLPVTNMEAFEPGIIIASDVGGGGLIRCAEGITQMPVGWKVLRVNAGSGDRPRVPTLRTLLLASAASGSVVSLSEARRRVELYIDHVLKGAKTLDFDHLDEVAHQGYLETKKRLAEPKIAALFAERVWEPD